MSEIILTSQDNLREIMAQVVEEKLIVFKHWFESQKINDERPLTRKEAMEYLSLPKSTFGRYSSKGYIPYYKFRGRNYYRRNELDEAMIPFNRRTTQKLVS